jgi:ubiquinone/menaquinone biosynthesis C-methylase UbiE
MLFEDSVANHERTCHELDMAKHYRILFHFARLMLQGNLTGGQYEQYTKANEYYAHVINDDVCDFISLRNKNMLDVGGLKGAFCRVLSQEFGVNIAVNLEPNLSHWKKLEWPNTVRGLAQWLPFRDNQFDFVMCREVFEHMPTDYLQSALNEMYRVTREGGVCYISIPPWYNPISGHGLMPFHYLPFGIARRLALFFFKNPHITNNARTYAELPLFKITYKQMMHLISASGFRVLATKDHHFRLHFLTKIPMIRDVAVPCLVFVLRK